MPIKDLIKDLQEFQQMNPNAKCFVRNLEGIYNENISISFGKFSLKDSENIFITSAKN
jgi:hypothetical protein